MIFHNSTFWSTLGKLRGDRTNDGGAASTSARADTVTKKACLNPNCSNEGTKRCSKCKAVWFCGSDCQALLRDSHKAFCKPIAEEPEATVLLLDGMGYLGPRNFYTEAVNADLARAGAKVATVDVSKKPGVFDQVGHVLSEAGRFTSCIALFVGSANLDAEKEFAANMSFRQKLCAWVERGGRLIIHGERSDLMGNWPEWFGKTWKCSTYCRTTHQCHARSPNDVHWCNWYSAAETAVTTSINVNAVMLSGVATEDILFGEELDVEDLDIEDRVPVKERLAVQEGLVAVAFGKFGQGAVSFFGDVNAEETTSAIMATIARGPRT